MASGGKYSLYDSDSDCDDAAHLLQDMTFDEIGNDEISEESLDSSDDELPLMVVPINKPVPVEMVFKPLPGALWGISGINFNKFYDNVAAMQKAKREVQDLVKKAKLERRFTQKQLSKKKTSCKKRVVNKN